MRNFFEGMEWWKLTPRFGNWCSFIPFPFAEWIGTRYSVASIDNDAYVAYFYNDTKLTGILNGLDFADYEAEWFNPRTGETTSIGKVRPFLGLYFVPIKPDSNDWVFYMHRT